MKHPPAVNTLLVGLALAAGVGNAAAQQTDGDNAAARQWQRQYPVAVAVATQSVTEITFAPTRNGQSPRVLERTVHDLLALQPQRALTIHQPFDEQAALGAVDVRDQSGRRVGVKPICGDVETVGIFRSDAQECRYDLPLARVGQRLTYAAQTTWRDCKYYTTLYFHDDFPVGVRKLRVVVPHWLGVEVREFNFDRFAVERRVTHQPAARTTTHEFTLRDLDARRDESHSPGLARTYPHLLVMCQSYEQGGQTHPLIGSVADLYGWYHGLTQRVSNDPRPLAATVQRLAPAHLSDEARLRAIFYWVQDSIRYLADETGLAGYQPQASHAVFANRYGDCKGMANLTKAMLRAGGFDARLTWIGTKQLPYDYQTPALIVDNHLICSVLLNGKWIFLDATEKFGALGQYADRIRGRQVMVEDGEGYRLDRVPNAPPTYPDVLTEVELSVMGNTLRVRGKTTLRADARTDLLCQLHQTPLAQWPAALAPYFPLAHPDTLAHSDPLNRDAPLVLTYRGNATPGLYPRRSPALQFFDHDAYVQPDPGPDADAWIADINRLSDVALPEVGTRVFRARLSVPPGYRVTHLPPPLRILTDDFLLQTQYTTHGDEISYERTVSVPGGLVRQSLVGAWNAGLRALRLATADAVVFTQLTD